MRTFELHRDQDETGISGTGVVAQGVVWDDDTVALRWMTEHKSVAYYDNIVDLMHIHGHSGKTRVVMNIHPFDRGYQDCLQDGCENCPFASIGGLDARDSPTKPPYVQPKDWPTYRAGYETHAREAYGDKWRTCSFGWVPAITIGAAAPPNPQEPTE